MRTLLMAQSGVIARRQLLDLGLTSNDVARLLRRRELVAVQPGVYVDHTGPPSGRQQTWAAVLGAWPAALAGRSALLAHQGREPAPRTPVEIIVARARHVGPRAGLVVRRHDALFQQVRWDLSPPRLRYEDAVIDVAGRASSDMGALAALADAVQSRRTTAHHLRSAAERRERLPRRSLLVAVLGDLSAGVSSALEHGYVHRVERAHAVAPARRQVRERQGNGVVYRDFDYGPVLVELDGRLFHDNAVSRDRDMDRDLTAALTGRTTLRLSWGQVYDRPCPTAARVAAVLAAHGVRSGARPCGFECPVGRIQW